MFECLKSFNATKGQPSKVESWKHLNTWYLLVVVISTNSFILNHETIQC